MVKCPTCNAEVADGAKFCCECGAKIPQNKECPQCHAQVPLAANFCSICGLDFRAGGKRGVSASAVGDRNAIAGDVHVDQSSTVNNRIVNNSCATTNNYYNQDDTKSLVKCVVCKRQVVVTEARKCRKCHRSVCAEHYDADTGMCENCVSKNRNAAEAEYRKALEMVLEDGRIDRDERKHLEALCKQLGLSASWAKEFEKQMRTELAAKKSPEQGEKAFGKVERNQYDQARELFFNEGKGREAVQKLESIYLRHPREEEVLSVYLSALSTFDEDRAKNIMSELKWDMVCAYLVQFDIELRNGLRNGDLVNAEDRLSKAERLWPDNKLLKYRRIELLYAMAVLLGGNRACLTEASDLLSSLGKPAGKLETSWQFYLRNLIAQALGDEMSVPTFAECKKSGYYHALVTGQLTGMALIDKDQLCTRCLRARHEGDAAPAKLGKTEFWVLKHAAENGDSKAAFIVGDYYSGAEDLGPGVNNLQEAFRWYMLAAEAGFADAQFVIGECLEKGRGCVQNDEAAIQWYEKAAEQGMKDAELRLEELRGAMEEVAAVDADEMQEELGTRYRVVISPNVLMLGAHYFATPEDFNAYDVGKLRIVDNLETHWNALGDDAVMRVVDEYGGVAFEAKLQPGTEGVWRGLEDILGFTYDGSGDEVLSEDKIRRAAVTVVVRKTYKCDMVSDWFTGPENFDSMKLRVLYSTFTHARERFTLLQNVFYGNNALVFKAETTGDPCEQASWKIEGGVISDCDVFREDTPVDSSGDDDEVDEEEEDPAEEMEEVGEEETADETEAGEEETKEEMGADFTGCLKSGVTKTITLSSGVQLEMVYCAPGTFMMGSPNDEEGHQAEEKLHRVTLTRGFWIGKYPITQLQWESVVGLEKKRFGFLGSGHKSHFVGDELPMDSVTWHDCQKFCRLAGHGLRLPSEAEWEYACRAGTTGAYAGKLEDMAWYNDNSGNKTHPVGMKMANSWGICDMYGNVREWCQDWFGDYCPEDDQDPLGQVAGNRRVARGGSKSSEVPECRSAFRWNLPPDVTGEGCGFRVASFMSTVEYEELMRMGDLTQEERHFPGEVKTMLLPGQVKLEMVYCAPGTFMMGSPEDEYGSRIDEAQHKVKLTRGFWIGKYPVTQQQWEAVMGTKKKLLGIFGKGHKSHFVGDNLPMESVTWNDCQEFCRQSGLGLRLPTEAEWEYACRAGTTGAYSGPIEKMAWHLGNSKEKTHPIGRKTPNPWGLYDMYGNVKEWCQDWYGEYGSTAVVDPIGPVKGEERVFRGGSKKCGLKSCRSARRWGADPETCGSGVGFRVACSAED